MARSRERGAIWILYLPDCPCHPKRYCRANCSSEELHITTALINHWLRADLRMAWWPWPKSWGSHLQGQQWRWSVKHSFCSWTYPFWRGSGCVSHVAEIQPGRLLQLANHQFLLNFIYFTVHLSVFLFLPLFPLYNHLHTIPKMKWKCLLFYRVS